MCATFFFSFDIVVTFIYLIGKDIEQFFFFLFCSFKASFILITDPCEATARPLCTDTRLALFLSLFIIGYILNDLSLLALEAFLLMLSCFLSLRSVSLGQWLLAVY